MDEERQIELYFGLKGLCCQITQSPDAKDLYSIRGITVAIQIPKSLLKPQNFKAIAQDIELLVRGYH